MLFPPQPCTNLTFPLAVTGPVSFVHRRLHESEIFLRKNTERRHRRRNDVHTQARKRDPVRFSDLLLPFLKVTLSLFV